MTDRTDEITDAEVDEEPGLTKETLEDLDASSEQAQDIRGGVTTKGQQCECGTA